MQSETQTYKASLGEFIDISFIVKRDSKTFESAEKDRCVRVLRIVIDVRKLNWEILIFYFT